MRRKEQPVYSRLIEVKMKPERREDFIRLLKFEVIPLLQRQPGYVDIIRLRSERDPNAGIAMVFWEDRSLADRFYNSDEYRRLRQRLLAHLQHEPIIKTYAVETPLQRQISSRRVA